MEGQDLEVQIQEIKAEEVEEEDHLHLMSIEQDPHPF